MSWASELWRDGESFPPRRLTVAKFRERRLGQAAAVGRGRGRTGGAGASLSTGGDLREPLAPAAARVWGRFASRDAQVGSQTLLSPSSSTLRSSTTLLPLHCAARFQWHDSDTHGRRQQPAEGWASWNDTAVAPGLSQDASKNANSAAGQAAPGHDGASGPRRRGDGLPPAAAATLGSKRGASQGGAPAAAAGAADWPGAGTLPPAASSAPTGSDACPFVARRSPATGLQPHDLLFADAGLSLGKRQPTPGLEGRERKRRDTTHSSIV